MNQCLAMLGMITLLALPAAVGAEVKLTPGSEEYFQLYGTTQPTESVTKTGVVKKEEPAEVSAPDATAPAEAKTGQERDSSPRFRWAGVDGAVW